MVNSNLLISEKNSSHKTYEKVTRYSFELSDCTLDQLILLLKDPLNWIELKCSLDELFSFFNVHDYWCSNEDPPEYILSGASSLPVTNSIKKTNYIPDLYRILDFIGTDSTIGFSCNGNVEEKSEKTTFYVHRIIFNDTSTIHNYCNLDKHLTQIIFRDTKTLDIAEDPLLDECVVHYIDFYYTQEYLCRITYRIGLSYKNSPIRVESFSFRVSTNSLPIIKKFEVSYGHSKDYNRDYISSDEIGSLGHQMIKDLEIDIHRHPIHSIKQILHYDWITIFNRYLTKETLCQPV